MYKGIALFIELPLYYIAIVYGTYYSVIVKVTRILVLFHVKQFKFYVI